MQKESRIVNVSPKVYKGTHYRSTLEAETAKVLDSLNIPYKYEYRKLPIFSGFRCPYQKDKVRDIIYKPDFEIGNIMLECKGFETPEWRIKKKLIFKYLLEKEPNTIFYQIHDCGKSLLSVLDNHWTELGYAIQVTSKPSKKIPSEIKCFESVSKALDEYNLKGKPLGPILKSIINEREYVYGYNWKLKKLVL